MSHYLQIPNEFYAQKHKKPIIRVRGWRHFFADFSLIFLLFPAAVGASQPQTQPTPQFIAGLIAQLGSEDASLRQSASNQLVIIGSPARPQILQATHSDDLEIREEAAQILLDLPWYTPDDPDEVRQILTGYGSPTINSRREIVNELAALDITPAFNALFRIFNQEPSNDVRWTIVSCFHEYDDGWHLTFFRELHPPDDDPPMLAACGFAFADDNPQKSRQYLQRCADQEFAHPDDDDGEFDYVIEQLCDLYTTQHAYQQAAHLRRQQYARGCASDESGIPNALLELFALQADDGPLPGFDADLQLAGAAANSPKIQYALSRLYARTGKPTEAQKTRDAAFAASTTPRQRFNVGDFLFQHGWDDLAKPEFQALLKMPPTPNTSDGNEEIANAYFRLAGLAIKTGDDLTAAQDKEAAMKILGHAEHIVKADARGNESPLSDQDIWAEIHWHYLRAAIAKHDEPEITKQLDQLQRLQPTDAEIVIDIYPLLKQRGQTQAADLAFDSAYGVFLTKLTADPRDPYLLNGIAWLCAECNQKLPDAERWAKLALQTLPENSAIIDTLADIKYHQGQYQEAIRLETHALQLTPGDDFMTTRLKLFQAATTQPTTNPQ